MLKPFGCLVYAVNLSPHRRKFDMKSVRCIFPGYNQSYKGYQVYDLENHKLFVSRDVKFKPNQFPFSCPESVTTNTDAVILPSYPTAGDDYIPEDCTPTSLVDEEETDLDVVPPTAKEEPPLRRSTRNREPPIWM